MIDPLEAVIGLARSSPILHDVVGENIAMLQKFGKGAGDWALGSQALTIRYDGGGVDRYLPRQTVRLEIRCYGRTFYAASKVYGAVVEWTRGIDREIVHLGDGTKALVYYVLLSTAPVQMIDKTISTPLLLCFADAAVSEIAV